MLVGRGPVLISNPEFHLHTIRVGLGRGPAQELGTGIQGHAGWVITQVQGVGIPIGVTGADRIAILHTDKGLGDGHGTDHRGLVTPINDIHRKAQLRFTQVAIVDF